MPIWKKNIFVRVIKSRMESENKIFDVIITEYPALTVDEVKELKNVIMA